MFYWISFGKNARIYLYKSAVVLGKEGMAVLVPTRKNNNREGIIVDVLPTIPEDIPFAEEEIKEVVCRNYAEICDNTIKHYLVSLIELFKKGTISRTKFIKITEGFVSLNRLVVAEEWLDKVIYHDIPEMQLVQVFESGCENDKEFWFRKSIKALEVLLYYEGKEQPKKLKKLNYDPIEDDEMYQRIELDVERKLNAELGDARGLGYCHRYWRVKKRKLKEEYGIEWKTPTEMNPLVCFD